MSRLVLVPIVLLLLPGSAHATAGWTWPLRGDVITPYRNGDDPYAGGQHRGIDIAGPEGTPVVAATAGTVGFVGVAGSSGLTVAVRSADGRFDTSYLHLSAVDVRDGDRLRVGQRLGAVGITGRRSATRPHLHFGVRETGRRHAYRDPLDFLPAPAPPRLTPDRPTTAPVPVRAPDRATPRLEPLRVRRRVPAGEPARHPLPVPGRRPRRVPRLLPGRPPTAVPAPVPARAFAGRGRRAAGLGSAPSLGAAPAPAGASTPPASEPLARPHEGRSGSSGRFDLGWALACMGMLLAAVFLGRLRTSDADPGSGRRLRLVAVLRPLLGRG